MPTLLRIIRGMEQYDSSYFVWIVSLWVCLGSFLYLGFFAVVVVVVSLACVSVAENTSCGAVLTHSLTHSLVLSWDQSTGSVMVQTRRREGEEERDGRMPSGAGACNSIPDTFTIAVFLHLLPATQRIIPREPPRALDRWTVLSP